jgi:CAAX protease family protein
MITAVEQRASRRGVRPQVVWAAIEVVVALAVIATSLTVPTILFAFSSTPWLLAIGSVFVWWRGPGWRNLGLRRPPSIGRMVAVAALVGLGYQFAGTYAVEPLIARWTSGTLPDVSQFRSLVGNERLLALWIALSWTLAAIVEELSFRGWLMDRLAELGHFAPTSWAVSALATSALFGILHGYQGLSGMIATGLTGLVIAGVYFATRRNLWACIVAHGVLDSAGFVLMYLGWYPGV